jgi:ABC-2 type transport system permease protein
VNAFTGTPALLRADLRRERSVLAGAIALFTLLAVGTTAQYARLFPTPTLRHDLASDVAGNAALTAFTGPLLSETLGGLMVWKVGDIMFTLVGLFALVMAVRLTRGEEESGRAELVAASRVGRLASMTASFLVLGIAITGVGVLVVLGDLAQGTEPIGTLAFGVALVANGWAFAALGILTAQVTRRSATAIGIAAAVLGAAYVLRFAADGSGTPWLRWLSVLGWAHQVRPFGSEVWAALLLPLGMTGVSLLGATLLVGRRDLGSGLVAERPGPARAGRSLGGGFGLAWRLQRGSLLTWCLVFAVLAAATSAVAGGMSDLSDGGGQFAQEVFRRYAADPGAPLDDVFVWMILLSLGSTAVLYQTRAVLVLTDEDLAGHAAITLSTGVSRTRWAVPHLGIAAGGVVLIMTMAGLAAGLGYGAASGDLVGQLGRVLAAALVLVPAIWASSGVTALAVGLVPRAATAIGWAVWVLVNLFGESLGPVLGIRYAVASAVIPFGHVSKILTGSNLEWRPLVVLALVAALLHVGGLLALRRCDIVTG